MDTFQWLLLLLTALPYVNVLKIYAACAAVQERRSESNSVMAAVFLLAVERDIGDVPVEPDTD